MTESIIHAEGIRKAFKGNEVLQGVEIQVERGEIFALLGSNGAGKTTMIKILATLLPADGGTAVVNGYSTATQPNEVRRSISLTGQFTAVDDVLSGRENLEMMAKLRHLEQPTRKAEEMLERFGLAEAAARRAGTYSGGMRRRLDLAMSLLGNPPLLFLDEPTTGLDPEARLMVWETVRELAKGGTTVFLTTQYLEEAEQLASRIAILHEGRILVCGTVEELKKIFPPVQVEYVEKQPSLEEVFLALIRPAQNRN